LSNEGNVAYEQQCDVILKRVKNDLLTIDIQGQLKIHHQILDFSSDHVKFEFQNGLLDRDGLLYVLNGPA
jgi:hypothetical protein